MMMMLMTLIVITRYFVQQLFTRLVPTFVAGCWHTGSEGNERVNNWWLVRQLRYHSWWNSPICDTARHCSASASYPRYHNSCMWFSTFCLWYNVKQIVFPCFKAVIWHSGSTINVLSLHWVVGTVGTGIADQLIVHRLFTPS